MAKPEIKPNPRVNQIFEDLEKYLEFTRSFGYKFNESELYDNKSYVYRQFTKFLQGKSVRDNWELDGKSDLA